MIAQVGDEAFDLGPGSSVAIPPGALHTFTVLTPSVRFLVVALSGGMGRFHEDLDASVPHGAPVTELLPQVLGVLERHGVRMEQPR